MEVHHSHHPGHQKKWTGYLLEFLMLFLAVFLGFTAENIREHKVERHREKDYIAGILQNLKDDTASINGKIPYMQGHLSTMDTIMLSSYRGPTNQDDLKQFYARIIKLGIYISFDANTATISQLKTGNLRLIRKSHAADSILKYDLINTVTDRQMQRYFDTFKGYLDVSYKVFDLKVFFDSATFTYMKLVDQTIPPFGKQQEYFNILLAMRVSFNGFLQRLQYQLKEATKLIVFLKRVYHVE